jgi:hypothetical protein
MINARFKSSIEMEKNSSAILTDKYTHRNGKEQFSNPNR